MSTSLSASESNLRRQQRQVRSLDDLARLLEISRRQLTYYSYGGGRRYRVFRVRKRHGGTRTIHEPAAGLKLIQAKLLQVFTAAYTPLPSVHGFVRGRSIATNAAAHAGQEWVLNIDLEDFFPTIHFGRVRGVLMKRPFSWPKNVATVVAHITTWNRTLPQGAPTSPILANLVARPLDLTLGGAARRLGCVYTRYADDITISTSSSVFPAVLATLDRETGETTLGHLMADVVTNADFRINDDKVRLIRSSRRQEVTGLVVNEFPNLTRRRLKRVRAMLHAWRKFGHDAAEAEYFARYDRNKERGPHSRATFRAIVKGHIDLVGMVRGWDSRPYRTLITQFADLVPDYSVRRPTQYGPLHLPNWTDGIWIVECDDDEDSSQGTGFELDGVGFVTCAHILFRRTATGWLPRSKAVVFHPARPDARYAIDPVSWDHDIDLAVCRFMGSRGWRFEPSLVRPKVRTPVVLAGYPQFADGAGLLEQAGSVVHERQHFGHPRLILDCRIIGGASGSPVLDTRHRVLGVATVGAASFEEHQEGPVPGAVPISLLRHLL